LIIENACCEVLPQEQVKALVFTKTIKERCYASMPQLFLQSPPSPHLTLELLALGLMPDIKIYP